jgi:hypothetical protein
MAVAACARGGLLTLFPREHARRVQQIEQTFVSNPELLVGGTLPDLLAETVRRGDDVGALPALEGGVR